MTLCFSTKNCINDDGGVFHNVPDNCRAVVKNYSGSNINVCHLGSISKGVDCVIIDAFYGRLTSQSLS